MKTLLIIDVQNDFCPRGALAVYDGDKVVPVINQIINKFDLVLASKDWHPEDTIHFENWPVHCVRNTKGAEFHPDLKVDKIDQILLKGTGNRNDGYSAFEATNLYLDKFLKEKGINELYVTGLATDYCVKATAIEASQKGFSTHVITDAIKAINAQPGDNTRALEEMKKAGCNLMTSKEILLKAKNWGRN